MMFMKLIETENRLIRTALEVVWNQRCIELEGLELRLMTGGSHKLNNIKHDFRQWQSGRLLASYEQINLGLSSFLGEDIPVYSWCGKGE